MGIIASPHSGVPPVEGEAKRKFALGDTLRGKVGVGLLVLERSS